MAAESRLAGLRTRHADVEGFRVAFYEGGPATAPAVVLLHGFSGDRTLWVRFARHLAKTYRVVVPDLPGHGDTDFVPGGGYGAPAQARRVLALLDRLEIPAAHLMGNSMGGFTTAAFARQYPDRILSAHLSDPTGVASPRESVLDILVREGRNPFLMHDVRQFPHFYALTMARPPWVPGIAKAAMAEDYVRGRDRLAEIFDDFFGRDQLDEHLGEIAVPTLVSWGELDQIIDVSAARVWVEGIPGAREIVYPGIGHMPMVEIPARSARDYREFLASV